MADSSIKPAKSDIETLRPYQRFIEHLSQLAELSVSNDDGKQISQDIMDKMLSAETLEEALAIQDSGLPSGKDLVDKELICYDFEVRKSDKPDAPLGHYLVVDAAYLETGEEVRFGVGAPNVVVGLFVARSKGHMPVECIIRSRAVANGDLLTFHLIPKRVVKATS